MKNIFYTFSISISIFIFMMSISPTIFAKVVRYELNVTKGEVNLSGKQKVDFALMVNNSIPAPTLEFVEGDEAEITVINNLPHEEVSIHWHGILLPPEMDGVSYVNTSPILSGTSYTFKFRIRQSGTYWYHSHTKVQEQKGVYGALIIHPRENKFNVDADKDIAVVLSDWSDEDADQIMKNLRKDGDYYLYKKNTMRSWLGAIQDKGLGTYLHNEWTRMGGMDYSDVGYDAFLINGKINSQLIAAQPGEKIRLRIINAAASTYFHVSLGNIPMNVISSDGVDVTPIKASEILMGMAETYDVLFQIPEVTEADAEKEKKFAKNYELKITAQDGTGSASTWIGAEKGEKIFAPIKPAPGLYAPMNHDGHGAQEGHANHSGHSNHGGHQGHHPPQQPMIETLMVDDLKAETPTNFLQNIPRYDIKLVLNGDMERYIWHINGKAIHQDRNIEIKENDVVRMTFVNETMMHHPMHLHGHFFRVLNKNEAFSPLKHTVDVPPHSSRTIEFLANEPGEWMLHCHNLYHMKTGMARVVKYSTYTPSKEIIDHQKHDPHLHDHLYYNGTIEAASNFASLSMRFSQTWDTLELEIESEKENKWNLEGDLFYRRYMNQFFNIVIGGTSFHQNERAVVGVGYTLPMLIESNLLIDHQGKLRLDLEKRFQWTKNIFTDAEISFRQEEKSDWRISLMYAPTWAWSSGINYSGDEVGVGVVYNF